MASYTYVAYGGGTNSMAMLIEMVLRGWDIPNAILFADTGGELPKTYALIKLFSDWLVSQGWPPITIVRNEVVTLEQDCLNRKAIPSIGYGFRTCSDRWKIRPQHKWLKQQPEVIELFKNKRRVKAIIGIDAGEDHRARPEGTDKFDNGYPLIEWGMDRVDCVNSIMKCQLPQPGKSSCFFCPNSTQSDVRRLEQQNPDLLKRGLDMEANADLVTIPGLGRRWSWDNLIRQGHLFPEAFDDYGKDMPCECIG